MAAANPPGGVAPARNRRRRRRALALSAIGLLAVLVVVVLAVVLFGDRWAETYVQRSVADLEEQLGRPVHVGDVQLRALRGQLQLTGVRIGPAQGEPEDAPPLMLRRAYVDVAVLRTLVSLGSAPRLERLELTGLILNVVERRDGTLNWERIQSALQPDEPGRTEPTEGGARARNTRIDRVAVSEATVHFHAAGADAPASISHIELQLRDAGYRSDLSGTLVAAVLAQEPNFETELHLRGARGGRGPRIESLRLGLEPTQLRPLAPFIARLFRGADALQEGVLSAQLTVDEQDAGAELATGEVLLSRGRFPRGERFDARLALNATVSDERIELRELELGLGPMRVSSEGLVRDLHRVPRVERLQLRSEALSFDALRAIYPALDRLTDPARLAGPFSITASGGGSRERQEGSFEVQLTEARVSVGDDFHKPRGTALWLRGRWQREQERFALAPATLHVADYELAARLTAENLRADTPRYDLHVSSPRPAVAGLLRLLPAVAQTVPEGRPLPGELEIDLRFAGTRAQYETQGSLDLRGLSVSAPETRLRGGGQARFRLDDDGGEVHADFSELTALYRDVVRKPEGAPLRARATLTRAGESLRAELSAQLATLDTRGTVQVNGRGARRTFEAELRLPTFELRPLLALAPRLVPRPVGDVRLGGDVHAQGVVNAPETVRVSIPSFVARAGDSELRASIRLQDPVRPRFEVVARSNLLRVEDFLPPLPAEHAAQTRQEPGALARSSGTLDLQIERGRAANVDFESLVLELEVEEGRGRAQTLELVAFGGRLTASDSEIPLAPGLGPYRIRGQLREVQVEGMLGQLVRASDLLRGQLDAEVDLVTETLTLAGLRHTLSGRLAGRVQEAAFLPTNGYGALAGSLQRATRVPALRRALSRTEQRVSERAWALRDLSGTLRFEEGAVLVDEPLTAETPQGELRVEGRMSLGDASDLRGTLALTPEALTALTNGQVELEEPVPVDFRVRGSVARPAFAFDVQSVIEPIARSFIEDQLERGGRERLEELLPRAPAPDEREGPVRRELERRLRGLF